MMKVRAYTSVANPAILLSRYC